MTSAITESTRKWRKSSLFSGFGVNWPSTSHKEANPSQTTITTINQSKCIPKRHNSVSFAICESFASLQIGGSINEKKLKRRGYYSQNSLSVPSASHHYSSVQSLVFRQKAGTGFGSAQKLTGTRTNRPIPRRPSTPLLPFSKECRKQDLADSCAVSFEEVANNDSAYGSGSSSSSSCFYSPDSSACSSCSCSSLPSFPLHLPKEITNEGIRGDPPLSTCQRCGKANTLTTTRQWTERERMEIECRLDQICFRSLGHLFVKCPEVALANVVRKEWELEQVFQNVNGGALCAEGNVQFHLLSMIAPVGKHVVNVGHSSINNLVNYSTSLKNYNRNSMKLETKQIAATIPNDDHK